MNIQECLNNFAIDTYLCDYLIKSGDRLTKFMKVAIGKRKVKKLKGT